MLHTLFLILFINQHVAQAAEDDTEFSYEKQVTLLQEMLNKTEHITTWESLVDIDQQIARMTGTLESRLYDLQCTYAYYAKNHVNSILENIDDNIMSFNNLPTYVRQILLVYWDVAMKTKNTIRNLDWPIPPWMNSFIEYLNNNTNDYEFIFDTFKKDLSIISASLKTVTLEPDCKPLDIESLTSNIAEDSLRKIPDFTEFNLCIDKKKEMENKTETEFVREYNLVTSVDSTEPFSASNAKIRTKVFLNIRKMTIDVYNNLLEICYLLYLNNLSYEIIN